MGFNWVDPLNLDKKGGIIGKLYPIINPVGAIKKNQDIAKDEAAKQQAELEANAAFNKANAINANKGMKKGGKVKAAAPKKETRRRGIAKDTKPPKTFARGGGIEQKGKTRGRFV